MRHEFYCILSIYKSMYICIYLYIMLLFYHRGSFVKFMTGYFIVLSPLVFGRNEKHEEYGNLTRQLENHKNTTVRQL